MSRVLQTVLINLPDSILRQARELAAEDKISIDDFIALAVAERVSAIRTVDYLQQRARRGSREKYERVLSKVADIEPSPENTIK